MQNPKFYYTRAAVRGFVENQERYLEFPTEEEYIEYIREQEEQDE